MAKKPTVTTITTGYSSADTLNENFEALREGFDNTLSLDGSTPNAMEADLDLNGNNIIGAAGLLVNGTDYLADVEAAKAAALVAQAAAELAETNAETAETNAATNASAAANSELDAYFSETAAASSATAAATSATASATSATNSATSASEAAASASAASTSETNAATSETNAATSETNAATSATESETAKTAAEAAKDAALAALDSFDDRYLGAKASDPTLDNDGNALVAGALYYNTTDDVMKVYEGSVWVAAYASLSGALLATNNLSDLVNATSARTNLGLGTAATTASTDYATAAQGTLADSATQPADLATVATSGVYSDLTSKPTLGTAAATASTDYATSAQGTTADSAVQPNDSPTFGGLTVDGTDTEVLITEDSEGSATLRFADTQADPSQSYAIEYDTSANTANFKINDTQRANFNAQGDYMVGPATTVSPFVIYTANNDATKAGVGLRQTGYIGVARMNDHTMMLNRMGSDGLTMGIRNDGTFVGGLGNVGGELTFHDSTSAEAMRLDSSGNLGIGTSNPATPLDVNGTVTATSYTEGVYAVTGTTPALDPVNGSIQTWTLSANSTPTESFSAGESMTLMIEDGTAYTITWPTITWVNNQGTAPTLATTGKTVIALWKVSTTLYGSLIADGS